MATVAEMITSVRYKMAEGSTVRIADADITAMLKHAYQRTIRLTKILRCAAIPAMSTADGTFRYVIDDFTTNPTEAQRMFQVEHAWLTAGGNTSELDFIPYSKLFKFYPNWPFNPEAIPTLWTMDSLRSIILYPIPDAATYSLKISGLVTPDVSTWTSSSVPTVLPEDFHEILEFYTANSLLTNIIDDEANVWRETRFGQLFVVGCKELISLMSKQGAQPNLMGNARLMLRDRLPYDWELGNPIVEP